MSNQTMTNRNVSLHPELRQFENDFQRARGWVDEIVGGLSNEQFNRRPDDTTWSLAECIDHLCATAREARPKFEKAVENGSRRKLYSKGPYKYGRFTNYIVDLIASYPPRRKFKAPKVFRPSSEPRKVSTTVAEFKDWQDWFVGLLYRVNGLDLGKVKIVSPVSRLFRFGLGQYLRVVAGHQFRHLHQAEGIKKQVVSCGDEK